MSEQARLSTAHCPQPEPCPPPASLQALVHGLAIAKGSFLKWLSFGLSRTVRPLRSRPTAGPSSLLRAGPPPCPASVLSPRGVLPLGLLPWHRGDGFPRSAREPGPGSRLCAGRRPGGKRVSPRLLPGLSDCPGFDAVLQFRHVRRFTRVRLPGPYLTGSLAGLFPGRSPPWLFTSAA